MSSHPHSATPSLSYRLGLVGMDRVVWFAKRPRADDVVRAAEQWARR